MRSAYKILVGKPEPKRPLRKLRRRWENDIRMDIKEIWGEDDWINVAQYMDHWWDLVTTLMNILIP